MRKNERQRLLVVKLGPKNLGAPKWSLLRLQLCRRLRHSTLQSSPWRIPTRSLQALSQTSHWPKWVINLTACPLLQLRRRAYLLALGTDAGLLKLLDASLVRVLAGVNSHLTTTWGPALFMRDGAAAQCAGTGALRRVRDAITVSRSLVVSVASSFAHGVQTFACLSCGGATYCMIAREALPHYSYDSNYSSRSS